ncbi:single-stranded DNA-binding protein [Dermacoccus nishinomiyaensis]|uniref:single-stranded DNA-binding protein n=1 Tax=Dermacoccus nishinomiyaensis TaxID=1274 RepID=UPI0013F47522|nr:single-stranded DNA-binding protein [Dermacoccus nishinomiyaensis]NHC32043.1 single-stranded DNA-binding protein [Dermacoccus nishinomiyaensis]
MAQGDVNITMVGNLVADPELRYTPNGAAVANFRIASTPRVFDRQSNEWKDGEALFMSCSIWREAAENVSESLQRGSRVIVTGRLKSRSYETKEGEKRTVTELEVDEVGPSLRYATAKVNKTQRSGGGQGGNFGGGNGGGNVSQGNFGGNSGGGNGFGGNSGSQGGNFGGSPTDDPWATGGNSGGGFGGNSGGNAGGQSNGSHGGGNGGWSTGPSYDEPPF